MYRFLEISGGLDLCLLRGGIPSSACTRRLDEICADGFSSSNWPERIPATRGGDGDGGTRRRRRRLCERGGAAT
ncbi:phospholipase D alpha 1 [Dorcoceras hygrometricum]|uniref:Phospholipase D alpha 1 n=1 Tax=Dorcoceras hygrometricum TaxID=472368 RepID=A0A2Z7DEK0_9LAMI|nr:phospholipase D alpha 1 [Dorcoceras hygrometricum]